MGEEAANELRQTLRSRAALVEAISPVRATGVVTKVLGLLVESQGPAVSVGDLCEVESADDRRIRTQVVGFREGRVLSMPLEESDGLQLGRPIFARRHAARVPCGPELLGRIIDGFGQPIDDDGPLRARSFREFHEPAPGPLLREPIVEHLSTGVRVIDALLPCGKGQRLGIFGGSGVGKTTLLGALARGSAADVNVIALIGERNREVRGFLDDVLGADGLRKSVVVVSTSDRPAPVRVRAAFVATVLAESFRDDGKEVLLIMDSMTRLAMAQREIGLASGEPPSQKGYTPSVFHMLPRIFERAGNFRRGSISGFFTVLVEGDDMNDPVADAARAILDGHIVLSRELAMANHFPAIDVLASVSRVANNVTTRQHSESASRLRDSLAAHSRVEDLVALGAYASGADPKADAAIQAREETIDFLRQDLKSGQPLERTLQQLQALAEKV